MPQNFLLFATFTNKQYQTSLHIVHNTTRCFQKRLHLSKLCKLRYCQYRLSPAGNSSILS